MGKEGARGAGSPSHQRLEELAAGAAVLALAAALLLLLGRDVVGLHRHRAAALALAGVHARALVVAGLAAAHALALVLGLAVVLGDGRAGALARAGVR